MQVSHRKPLHTRIWLLSSVCCISRHLCLAGTLQNSDNAVHSDLGAAGCTQILAAGPERSAVCSGGNSLLQLAAKPSRTSIANAHASQEETDDVHVAPARSASAKGAGETSTRSAQPPVVAAAASAATMATARATMVQVARAMRHYMYMAQESGSFISVTIFALICLLGLFILCFIMHVQSENRRAELLVQGAGRTTSARSPPYRQLSGRMALRPPDENEAMSSRGRPAPASPQPGSVTALGAGRALSPTNTLCPGLVVPADADCVLVIRMLPKLRAADADIGDAAAGRGALELDIFDLLGKPVLSASIAQPWPKQGHVAVTLRTLSGPRKTDSTALTVCRAGSSGHSVYVYDKDDVLFGSVMRDAAQQRQEKLTNFHRYVLNRNAGDALLVFEGTFEEHRLRIFDPRRTVVGHAEPCKQMSFEPDGRFYQVRIAAAQDVGLVLSALLSIDAMEAGSVEAQNKLAA